MPTEPIISVQNISKSYLMWDNPSARLISQLWLASAACLPMGSRYAAMMQRRAERSCRNFHALENVSFDVFPGESLGIIGRNGSGKSTLLQIIAGTLQPTSGVAITKGRVAALLELGSGFNPDFTGRENVYLTASVLGLSKKEVDSRFDDIAAFADIGAFMEEPIKTYSSGMALRLAFAVIVHVDADVMIIDEALAVGDVFFVQKCMRWIRNFTERGTLLFVTHNASDITTLCSKGIWLHEGRVQMDGSAKLVTENYLAHYHADMAGFRTLPAKTRGMTSIAEESAAQSNRPPPQPFDQRLQWLNATQFRNDIRPLDFDPSLPSYGAGGARIIDVEFTNHHDGRKLSWIVGGEWVTLRITARAAEPLNDPIIGFYLKDRLGQYLFGDNTYLSTLGSNQVVPKDGRMTARFTFQMPRLPRGQYAVSAAIAIGSQDNHMQQHWMHESLILESINENPNRGLLGILIPEIQTEIAPN